MTPQERELVTRLFDRLTQLESSPRDAEAEAAIADGLERAPNAVYALVQTALVQDEALKRADARIRELEAELGADAAAPREGGFLDDMRDSLFGRRAVQSVPSVPSVPPGEQPMGVPPGFSARMQQDAPMREPPSQTGSSAGSFLGTAAAAAAGVIGGAFLLEGIRTMMGQRTAAPGTDPAAATGSPWTGNPPGGDLAREAGLNDIGSASTAANDSGSSLPFGLFGDDRKAAAGSESEGLDEFADDFDIGDIGSDLL